MFSFFRRIWNFFRSEAHSTLDKLENPIKMTEQGIRDLKKDLSQANEAYAQVRASAIRFKTEAQQKANLAQEYEKKAMMLLEKAQKGEITSDEADKLALEVIAKRDENAAQAAQLKTACEQQEQMSDKLQSEIGKLKKQVEQWEGELTTLRARHQTAQASATINKHIANIDSNGTVAMLEKLKEKVAANEALAASYEHMAKSETSLDDRLTKVLGNTSGQSSLDALKAKMNQPNGLPAGEKTASLPGASVAGQIPAAADSLAALKAQIKSKN